MLLRFVLCPALVLIALSSSQAETGPTLSSPMVDTGIYREGEVRRLTGRYGDWTVICDEIIRLKQRYCSLRSTTPSDHGRSGLVIDVSTGDNGRPAALLHLPLAVSLPFGVLLDSGTPGPSRKSAKSATHARSEAAQLTIASCNDHECLAAWSLVPSSIDALNAGRALRLVYCGTPAEPLEFAADLKAQSCAIKKTALISGAGFRDAIRASINWQAGSVTSRTTAQRA